LRRIGDRRLGVIVFPIVQAVAEERVRMVGKSNPIKEVTMRTTNDFHLNPHFSPPL